MPRPSVFGQCKTFWAGPKCLGHESKNKNSEKPFCPGPNLFLTFTINSFTDEVVNKQRNIYRAFKFVSVVNYLLFITFIFDL